MNPQQRKLIKAAQAEFDRVYFGTYRANLPLPLNQINAAQNTLRTCLEATLNKAVPFETNFLVEIAIRLASYAISAAAIEDQEILVSQFLGAFADAHLRRISEGKRISTEWQMKNGQAQRNFPEYDR